MLKRIVPKIVDHERRRHELGRAVWRVIRERGVERVSVRAVAQESGWSAGALRYYFASQSELLAFAMRLVIDRVAERIDGLGPFDGVRPHIEALLGQVLPLNEERLAEFEVWFAFTGRALADPDLRGLLADSHAALRGLCLSAVLELVADPAAEIDVELEAERLHALVDGISLHAVMQPESMPPERVRTILARHLDGLTAAGAP